MQITEPPSQNDPLTAPADSRESARSAAQARLDRLQQLRWRSRRGLLELELLLLPFAADCLEALDEAGLADYERLLACEDLDIYDWLQQRSLPEDETLLPIVTAIHDYQRSLKQP